MACTILLIPLTHPTYIIRVLASPTFLEHAHERLAHRLQNRERVADIVRSDEIGDASDNFFKLTDSLVHIAVLDESSSNLLDYAYVM